MPRNISSTQQQMKEHFQLEQQDTIGREELQVRPGSVLVTMRDPVNPYALKWALARTRTDQQDIVVLTARMMGAGGPEYVENQIFSEHEQMLFTKAVSVAESFGKHISLLVVPAGDIFAALVQAANSLEVAALVSGLSTRMSAAGAGVPRRSGLGKFARAEAPVHFLRDHAGWRSGGFPYRPACARRCARKTCSSSIGYG